jgi:hypothetical protein
LDRNSPTPTLSILIGGIIVVLVISLPDIIKIDGVVGELYLFTYFVGPRALLLLHLVMLMPF